MMIHFRLICSGRESYTNKKGDHIDRLFFLIVTAVFNGMLIEPWAIEMMIDKREGEIHDLTNEENYREVKLIKLDQNIGYGKANNIALRQINTPYALILNPDAFIYSRDIESIIAKMDKDEKTILGAPILLDGLKGNLVFDLFQIVAKPII